MTEFSRETGKEFHDLLVDAWSEYKHKWDTVPDVLYINTSKFAQFFKWAGLFQRVIKVEKVPEEGGFDRVKYYFIGAEIISIPSFSKDFIWLEKADVKSAIQQKKDSVDKIYITDSTLDYDQSDEMAASKYQDIDIPKEVLDLCFK